MKNDESFIFFFDLKSIERRNDIQLDKDFNSTQTIQHFWNLRQRISILDCDNVQISIVYTEAKFFFKFLDEENRNNHLRVIDLNEIFAQIFIQITMKF